MKKRLGIVIAALIAAAIVFTGCLSSEPAVEEDPTTVIESHVVVIGSGAAGLAAALEARDQGVEVVVLEKMNFTGGTTRVSGGGLCAAGVDIQLDHGITEDSPEVHYEDMMRLGKHKNNPELVRTLTENAKDAVDWVRTKGIKLKDEVISYMTTYPRIYWVEGGGLGFAEGLTQAAEDAGVSIELNTKATKLIQEDGRIVGVLAEKDGSEITYRASKGVVLATGGFAWNQDIFEEYAPQFVGIQTNNPENVTTGDGIIMAREVGAKLIDMELGRFIPFGVRVGKGGWASAPNSLVDAGASLVNKEGLEFLSGDEEGDALVAAILAQSEHKAYMVFNQEILDEVGEKAVASLKDMGALHEGSVAEVAEKLEIDVDGLSETVGKDEKIFSIVIEPYVHSTTGGVAINTSAQVLTETDEMLPGLYAAGEVTGGVQGADQKNALIECLVYGRIAGKGAASGE